MDVINNQVSFLKKVGLKNKNIIENVQKGAVSFDNLIYETEE